MTLLSFFPAARQRGLGAKSPCAFHARRPPSGNPSSRARSTSLGTGAVTSNRANLVFDEPAFMARR
jgi:hypothetical protein